MLVDFDWAGKNRAVQYPSNVNIKEVRLPEGVCDGQLISAEHDMEMLGYIIGS
jgi:hypothetical protein